MLVIYTIKYRQMRSLFFLILFFNTFSAFSQAQADLRVQVEGLRNQKGTLSITLFNSAEGFPEDVDNAFKWRSIDLNEGKPVFVFEDLPAGEYAYAILHDEDGDGEMKKNLLGIPREGFGFSNNYEPKIKNPSFKDASFFLRGKSVTHEIEIIYF